MKNLTQEISAAQAHKKLQEKKTRSNLEMTYCHSRYRSNKYLHKVCFQRKLFKINLLKLGLGLSTKDSSLKKQKI